MQEFTTDNAEEKDLFILDSSMIHKEKIPLTQALYSSFDGLNIVDIEELFVNIQRMNKLISFSNQGNLAVIRETVEENNEYLRIINQQRNYIHKRLDDRPSLKRDRYGDMKRDERELMLEAIRGYTNTLYKLNKRISGLDPRKELTPVERDNYFKMLDMVRAFSFANHEKDILRKQGEFKNHNGTGYMLETDNKLIALAFTLSYRKPIIILTRDRGLCNLVDKITLEMPFDSFRKKFNLLSGDTNPVDFTDLDNYMN